MASREWFEKHSGVKRFTLLVDEEDRARWDEDAWALGFSGFGTHYLRWLLNSRHEGRLLHLDPATQRFGEMIGAVFGKTAGEVVARMELAYLDGK